MTKFICDTNNLPKHIASLFVYLRDEVYSAGGDGDALIICKCYDAISMGQSFHAFLNRDAKIDIRDDSVLVWDWPESSWYFTNNQEYKPASWQQCTIII